MGEFDTPIVRAGSDTFENIESPIVGVEFDTPIVAEGADTFDSFESPIVNGGSIVISILGHYRKSR